MRSPFPLPTPRPSGHAAVLRCGEWICVGGAMGVGFLDDGREGGPRSGPVPWEWGENWSGAGLFPGSGEKIGMGGC